MSVSSFDLPRGDKTELGEALKLAVDESKRRDAGPTYVQSVAVHNYLKGARNFDIMDPFDPGNVLLAVDVPRNEPMWEQVVGDVSMELGRQLQADFAPEVSQERTDLRAIRNAAVTRGLMSRYVSPEVLNEPYHNFQRLCVLEGCAGLAVTQAWYPGTGWGIRFNVIPSEEIVMLPVGPCDASKVNALGWRRWNTLDYIRSEVSKAVERGLPVRPIPRRGTDAFDKLMVKEVAPGYTVQDAARGEGVAFPMDVQSINRGSAFRTNPKNTRPHLVEFAEWTQLYITPDRRHVSRLIWLVGELIVLDVEYPEHRMPQVPMGVGRYADVGGPRGRSYAFPKIMASIYGERFLSALSKNVENLDAYGILMLSTGMGMDIDDIKRHPERGGYRIGQFTPEPGAQGPIQFLPAPLGQVVGSLPQFFLGVQQSVFPTSPIFSGQTSGREDSDVALRRLNILSNTQIAAGAISRALAFSQVYAATLEMIAQHHQEGDSIPLTYIDDSMAGVILDAEPLPKSMSEIQREDESRRRRAVSNVQRGVDPGFASTLAAFGFSEQEIGGGQETQERRVPRGSFTVGPNVIPHPNEVTLNVRSIMPRDKQGEQAQLLQEVQLGHLSVVEYHIEVRKRGLAPVAGGKATWNAYKLAVLNLLSAYGDGVESGPTAVPENARTQRIGWWVMRTFMDSIEYAIASEEVRQKIRQLMLEYQPVNTPQTQPTTDEIATLEGQRQQQVRQSMSGAGNPTPG